MTFFEGWEQLIRFYWWSRSQCGSRNFKGILWL